MKNKYIKQDVKRALGPVPKDKRIYLNIDYKPRRFSEYSNCRFDPEKKIVVYRTIQYTPGIINQHLWYP